MTITIPKPPKPILKIPKVPGWLFIAALVAQYAIMNSSSINEPSCTLNVQWPHYSESLAKSQIDAIKLNATSECTEAQEYTEIDAVIRMKVDEVATNFRFDSVKQLRDPRKPNNANFRSIWRKCKFGLVAQYRGEASGIVKLQSGVTIKVSDISGNYRADSCRITAK